MSERTPSETCLAGSSPICVRTKLASCREPGSCGHLGSVSDGACTVQGAYVMGNRHVSKATEPTEQGQGGGQ